MSRRGVARMSCSWVASVAVATVVATVVGSIAEARSAAAQRPSEASTPDGQAPPAVPGGGGRGGGRGGRGGPQGPPPPARQGAPVDLTGTWVSVVTEDWQWRMMTPKKGDYASVPLNPEGRRVADTWDASQDGMCQAYGVAGVMRQPGRLRISWQDDNTLKIETDAGVQTRLLRFPAPAAPASPASAVGGRTLQGTSMAEWQRAGGAFDAFLERGAGGAAPQRFGSLKVTTTNHTGGWLRRNGAPYSPNATVTEFFTRFSNPDAGDWFIVTTVVEDPQYLAQPFITSSNFKKEADGSKWSPAPCRN